MSDRRHVLVDLDHTLSNAFPRDGMIGGPWDDYHAASVADEPLHDVVALVNALHDQGFTIVAITARPEKWRQLTGAWLRRHGIYIDEILMRPDEAFHPAPELKIALARARFPDLKNQVALLLEDRDDVVAAFREEGITVLQVHARRQE